MRLMIRGAVMLGAEVGVLFTSSGALHASPGQLVTSRAPIAPKQLALPRAVFAPATLKKSLVDPNANNKSKKVWPRERHSKNYTWFNRVNGWYQYATWTPSGLGKVEFQYDGSIFKEAKGALGAWHDGSGFPLGYDNDTPQSCPAALPVGCSRILVTYSDHSRAYNDEILSGRCLVETQAYADAKTFAADGAQIMGTLNAMGETAFRTLSSLCGASATPTL